MSPMGPSVDTGRQKPLAPQPPHSPSPLSPNVVPFHSGCFSGGSTKSRRWVEDDGEESDDDNPTTYLNVVHRPAKRVDVFPPCAQSRLIMTRGRGVVDTGR